jgi:16S rRNA (uracil1498-N3)-methyltransferase
MLPDGSAHHALRVLRMKAGDAVTVFNGEGGEYAGRIVAHNGRAEARIGVAVDAFFPVERESPLDVTLVQGVASPDRMDYAMQKAVELGVTAIQPVLTERTVTKLDVERSAKRAAHWQQIAVAACEQCGRNRVPVVHSHVQFKVWIAAPSPSAPTVRLLLAPDAETTLADLPAPSGAVELLIGPEGGLTDAETSAALHAGWRAVRTGPRVLRTETVAPAMLAALNTLWGDWR